MKYTESNKEKFKDIPKFFSDYEKEHDATKHPQYEMFKRTLQAWRIADSEIGNCWTLLIDGVVEQRKLNHDAAGLMSVNLAQLSLYCCGDSRYEGVCRKILAELDATKQLIFFKNVVKASNRYYVQFASNLKDFLSTDGVELSLWSGGYDLSPFSKKMGKCPLEKTKLGELLDNLPITQEWKEEAALWNIVSRIFVQSYHGKNAHVYLRTVDSESVLLRQEIPMIEQNKVKMHWHIFYHNGTEFAKVGYERKDKELSPKAIGPEELPNGFDKDIAFDLLAKILKQSEYTKNKQAYDQVILRELVEYRAPFAYYG